MRLRLYLKLAALRWIKPLLRYTFRRGSDRFNPDSLIVIHDAEVWALLP